MKLPVSSSTAKIKHQRNILQLTSLFVLVNIGLVSLIVIINQTNNDTRAQTSGFASPLWSTSYENGNYAYGAGVSSSGNVSVVNDGYGGGKAVKVVHPPNQYYGAAWFPRLSGNLGIAPLEDAYFRYYLKPDPNYHFRLEAKIPGLAGNTGNNYFPSGCDPVDSNQGWSGRLQWGMGPTYNNQKGRIQTYLYVGHPASNTGGCGFKANWDEGAELERGKWACIEIRYKMNTPGQNNGTMQGWFNGVKRYERNDIRFRNNTNIKATMLVNQFYHGGTAAWQPIQTQHYLYDNLAISNQRIGCDSSTSTTPPPPPPAPAPAPAPPPPPPPTSSPANYSFTIDGTTMRWNAVPNSTKYKIYLEDTQTYIILSASTTSYTVPPPASGSTREVNWTWYDGQDHWGQSKTINFATTPSTPPPPPPDSTPTPTPTDDPEVPEVIVTRPSDPPPHISIPDADGVTPVPITDSTPKNNDGQITADFDGDGLNDLAFDLDNDGYINPAEEIIVRGSDEPNLTDKTKQPIVLDATRVILSDEFGGENADKNVTFKVAGMPEATVPKTVAYSFLTAGGISLVGIGSWLAITKLAVLASFRGKLGL